MKIIIETNRQYAYTAAEVGGTRFFLYRQFYASGSVGTNIRVDIKSGPRARLQLQ